MADKPTASEIGADGKKSQPAPTIAWFWGGEVKALDHIVRTVSRPLADRPRVCVSDLRSHRSRRARRIVFDPDRHPELPNVRRYE
jgi:hypothetical protein